MQAPGFDLVAGLIGRGGRRVRAIADATGAKVRIRGRGSGHYEVDGVSEAPAPLMVAVTTESDDGARFKAAVEMVLVELRVAEQRFQLHCQRQGACGVGPRGLCFSVGALAEEAEELLRDLLPGLC